MMLRFIRSLILGLLMGTMVGLFLGWVRFPSEIRSSSMSDLAQRYHDEYSVMIAAGYAADEDAAGAIERLNLLTADDAAISLRQSTERIITTSSRDLNDIQLLVYLADGLGQLTSTMQPFHDASRGKA